MNEHERPFFASVASSKYLILTGAYILITGAAFFRIHRQPYGRAVKWEQYETVFKGTTLAAALVGIGISGRLSKRRSEAETQATQSNE